MSYSTFYSNCLVLLGVYQSRVYTNHGAGSLKSLKFILCGNIEDGSESCRLCLVSLCAESSRGCVSGTECLYTRDWLKVPCLQVLLMYSERGEKVKA